MDCLKCGPVFPCPAEERVAVTLKLAIACFFLVGTGFGSLFKELYINECVIIVSTVGQYTLSKTEQAEL